MTSFQGFFRTAALISNNSIYYSASSRIAFLINAYCKSIILRLVEYLGADSVLRIERDASIERLEMASKVCTALRTAFVDNKRYINSILRSSTPSSPARISGVK